MVAATARAAMTRLILVLMTPWACTTVVVASPLVLSCRGVSITIVQEPTVEEPSEEEPLCRGTLPFSARSHRIKWRIEARIVLVSGSAIPFFLLVAFVFFSGDLLCGLYSMVRALTTCLDINLMNELLLQPSSHLCYLYMYMCLFEWQWHRISASLGKIRMCFLIVLAMNSCLNVSSLSVLCLITLMMSKLFCVVPI
jgi:hypothetical protein